MMCNLDTYDMRNCSVCTCAVQIGCIQCSACVFVCVYGGTQRALAMRLFTRVWGVSATALVPPRPISAVEFVQVRLRLSICVLVMALKCFRIFH